MNCDKCPVRKLLEETIAVERERNKMLQDKLIALADTRAYQSISYVDEEPSEEYYGVGLEERVEYDEFGQKVLVKDRVKEEV